ncbi:peptidase C15 [uncultured Alsobacter sp.]|uniref:pyroglutamyl-peptidase I family protein n=1 Tax=uncultured Alsobacter sp. TaxID=1748258 RepID=UPI0025DBC42F|nr:peptidase C15 [uncultured Alsobacter sp.]
MTPADDPIVLVTGFGPYPRVRVNPTGSLAARIGRSRRFSRFGLAVRAHVFETSYAAAGRDIGPLLEQLAPVACLHLGLAPRAPKVRVETRAENRTRSLAVDVRGRLPGRRALVPQGPSTLRGHALAGPARAAFARAGIPARLSRDAGAYLCNAVYYWSLLAAAGDAPGRPVLFVHLPWPAPRAGERPAGRRRRTSRPPTVDAMARALEALALALGAAGRRV